MLIHIVGMETSVLHGLILCVSEGFFWLKVLIHIVGMETSVLHGLILCVSEGLLFELLCIHRWAW